MQYEYLGFLKLLISERSPEPARTALHSTCSSNPASFPYVSSVTELYWSVTRFARRIFYLSRSRNLFCFQPQRAASLFLGPWTRQPRCDLQ